MSKVLVEESSLSSIGSAIRQKNGTSITYKPLEMAQAILDIPAGGSAVIESKNITENGTYTAPTGVDGYNPVTVDVPNSYSAADDGKVVSNGALVAQTARSSEIIENGTYDTTLNDEVTVNVFNGSGATILSGTSDPTSEQGNNGDIYFKTISQDDSGYGWCSNRGTICNDTATMGTLNNRNYWKTSAEPALVAWPSTGYKQPELASTIPEACSYRASSGGPFTYDYSYVIDGVTWYFNSGNHGYNYGTPSTSFPTLESIDFSTQAGAEKFLTDMGVELRNAPREYINFGYLKKTSAWQNLIGSDIDDINTGGGGSLPPGLSVGTDAPSDSAGEDGDYYFRSLPDGLMGSVNGYVDTDYAISPADSVEIEFYVHEYYPSNYELFAGVSSNYSSDIGDYLFGFNNRINLDFWWSNSASSAGQEYKSALVKSDCIDTPHVAKIESGKVFINGELLKTFSGTPDSTPIGILRLFNVASTSFYGRGIVVMHLKIWDSAGNLVRYYTPFNNNGVWTIKDSITGHVGVPAGTALTHISGTVYQKVSGVWKSL